MTKEQLKDLEKEMFAAALYCENRDTKTDPRRPNIRKEYRAALDEYLRENLREILS